MSQFGCHDSPDNRKTIFRLLDRLGHGMSEMQAAIRRGNWIRGLLGMSSNGFADWQATVTPMTAGDAYNAFIAMTVFGVDMEQAVRALEQEMRR